MDIVVLEFTACFYYLQMQSEPTTPLNFVVNSDDVVPIVQQNESMQQALISHLPESLQTSEELLSTLRSPQLQQALSALTGALQTDNLNAVFANFGLDPAAGAEALQRGNGVQAMLDAIQAQNPPNDAEKKD